MHRPLHVIFALTSHSHLIHPVHLAGLDALLPRFPFISVPTLSVHRWHLFVRHGGAKSSELSPWTRVKSAPSVRVTISARVANRLPSQTVSVWACVHVYVCLCGVGDMADCASKYTGIATAHVHIST